MHCHPSWVRCQVPKVFTPYLGVLHVMWYIDDPWLCHDQHTHGRWLSHSRPCMDVVWHSSLEHQRTRQHDDILHDVHMESGWFSWSMTCLSGRSMGILKEAFEPQMAWDTWLLAWSFVLGLRMLGLKSEHVGGMELEVHISWGGGMEIWNLIEVDHWTILKKVPTL